MPSDITNPLLAEADRAREDLRSRVDQLRRKLDDVRDRIARIDLSEQIHRHPWPAVGIAFALGALAGRGVRRPPRAVPERSFGRTALGALGAVALHVLRELALARLGRSARHWWSEHGGEPLDDIPPGHRAGTRPEP
ncbi:MAG TPA: hypothetical protein VF469_28740 [Kofleriaceae bacterium]